MMDELLRKFEEKIKENKKGRIKANVKYHIRKIEEKVNKIWVEEAIYKEDIIELFYNLNIIGNRGINTEKLGMILYKLEKVTWKQIGIHEDEIEIMEDVINKVRNNKVKDIDNWTLMSAKDILAVWEFIDPDEYEYELKPLEKYIDKEEKDKYMGFFKLFIDNLEEVNREIRRRMNEGI